MKISSENITLKNILILLVLILCVTIGYSQEKNRISLSYGILSVTVPIDIDNAKDNNRISVVSATYNKERPISFGIQLNAADKKVLDYTLLELRDASTKKPIRNISVRDLYNTESAGWKLLPKESAASPGKIVSGYAFTDAGNEFKLFRTVQVVSDEHLPTGKGISITYSLVSNKSIDLQAKFMGECSGLFGSQENAFFITDSNSKQSIVLAIENGVSVQKLKSKKGDPLRFMLESPAVKLIAGESAKILSITITGTTIEQAQYAEAQVRNLMTYFQSKSSKPELVAVTSVDRRTTNPGDTVTYTIDYHNIGTAAGADIEINNPIPDGALYIEGSAAGIESTIDIRRSNQERAESIFWKFNTPIYPGECRSVGFKVIVE